MNTWPDAGMTPFRNEKISNWEGAYRVPAMIRWPGHIAPNTVSNAIISHLDWFPTLMAAVGVDDIKEQLLRGASAIGRNYKVHLDGYNVLPYLTGQEAVYGVPPEQVVGSSIETDFEMRAGEPVIVRRPEVHFIDDKEGKPVAIERFIGRRPLAAFGNSDGDLQMLQWTTAGPGPRFGLVVHHTDAQREVAYDRDSAVGRLDVALDEARKRGWSIVDMKRDWEVIFPAAKPAEARSD